MTFQQISGIFVLRLKRLSVVLVYLSLFIIQLSGILFSGRENNNQASFACLKEYKQKPGSDDASLVRLNSKAEGHKCIFRPNKRFHPEQKLHIHSNYLIPVEVVVYTEPARIGHPTTYLLFTVILARAMRGPPVVA